PRLAVAVKVRKDQARAETFCRALPVQQLADLGGVRLGVNATGLKLRATQLGALQVVEVLRQEVDGAAGAVIMSVRIGDDCISTQAGLTGPACGASGFPLSSQFPLTSVFRGRGALAARGQGADPFPDDGVLAAGGRLQEGGAERGGGGGHGTTAFRGRPIRFTARAARSRSASSSVQMRFPPIRSLGGLSTRPGKYC